MHVWQASAFFVLSRHTRKLNRTAQHPFLYNAVAVAAEYHSDSGVYGHIPVPQTPFKLPEATVAVRAENSNAFRLVDAYRRYGHLRAAADPLQPSYHSPLSELSVSSYGLTNEETCSGGVVAGGDMDSSISIEHLSAMLHRAYCGSISVEFMHLPTEVEREWFAGAMEDPSLQQPLSNGERITVCEQLLQSQEWDLFLARKYQSVKRYGGEGAEALLPFYSHTFHALAAYGVRDVVVGMAHRGRLNLLSGLLNLPPQVMFRKMSGLPEFSPQFCASGDVLSHLTSNTLVSFTDKSNINVQLLANPSHLEAVNPVAVGRTRALHRRSATGQYRSSRGQEGEQRQEKEEEEEEEDVMHGAAVCLQVHGDAAVSGQGIVQETLAISALPHFDVGGSLHVIVNNQVGFTTPGARGRSSIYASDVALLARLPVLHVNGDHPEEVCRAARLAVAYQQRFRRDVFVDVACWRRHGHNEMDNPRFTNPAMYHAIDAMTSVPDVYAAQLVTEGVLAQEDVSNIIGNRRKWLDECHADTASYTPQATEVLAEWDGLVQAPPDTVETWDTGLDANILAFVAHQSVELPDHFNVHPHLAKHYVAARRTTAAAHGPVDWATAEAMAFGSLLLQGYNVRLSGQDVGRGTFSHRHCALVDQDTGHLFLPLNDMAAYTPGPSHSPTAEPQPRGSLEVANSALTEEAVLGFEYGLSVNDASTLCIWEAQFGDFFNGAQIILDAFISSGETKWLYQSGLVVLLPHGFDGAGPEHSCCRVERFLEMCNSSDNVADSSAVNWMVAAPTTPAQYFHLLRQQVVRPYRKPLVVVGPKTLLRLPAATSLLAAMAPGTHFQPLLDDPSINAPAKVRRVVLVTGKHYYEVVAERGRRAGKTAAAEETAVVRLESLCPFPAHEINKLVKKYSLATKWVWSQEEPRNLGPWSFVFPRLLNICGTKVAYAGRGALAAPAVGVAERHRQEVAEVMDLVFA